MSREKKPQQPPRLWTSAPSRDLRTRGSLSSVLTGSSGESSSTHSALLVSPTTSTDRRVPHIAISTAGHASHTEHVGTDDAPWGADVATPRLGEFIDVPKAPQAESETVGWWGGTTPTMPSKKANRERTVFDVSRMLDTGIFSLQDLPPVPTRERDHRRPVSDCPALDDSPLLGRLQLEQESCEVEDVPVPDHSPIIPLAILPDSPKGWRGGASAQSPAQAGPPEEVWSSKRLGKRPDRGSSLSLDPPRQALPSPTASVRGLSHHRSISSASSSSLTSFQSSSSAPRIPVRISSRSSARDGEAHQSKTPPSLPVRSSSLLHHQTHTSPLKPVFPAADYAIDGSNHLARLALHRGLHRRTTSASTASSLPTVNESPADLDTPTQIHDQSPASSSRLCQSASQPNLRADALASPYLYRPLRASSATLFVEPPRRDSDATVVPERSSSAPLSRKQGHQQFDQVQVRSLPTEATHSSSSSSGSKAAGGSLASTRSNEEQFVPEDVEEMRLGSILAPGQGARLTRQRWARAGKGSAPVWGRQGFLAVLRETECAMEEAVRWDWPSPPLTFPASMRTVIPGHTAVDA